MEARPTPTTLRRRNKPRRLEKLLGGEQADLCITDLPYSVQYNVSNKSEKNKVTGKFKPNRAPLGDENLEATIGALPQIFNHLIPESTA